jgi:DNA-binding CsgD family transcriptional regulator
VPLDRDPTISTDPALVGRAAEVAHLGAGFADAVAGGARVVRVRGPAGMGKTALLDAVDYPDAVVLRASYQEPAGQTDPAVTDARAVIDTYPDHVAVRELTAPLPDAAHPARSDDESSADTVLRELCAPVLTRLASGPVVIVMDDVHRCTEHTLRWLDFLLRRSARLPLFVVLAHATDQPVAAAPVLTELLARHRCTTVELRPLSPAAVAELIGYAFGEVPHALFSRCCVKASAGNPAALRRLLEVLLEADVRPDEQSTHLATSAGKQIAAMATVADLGHRPEYVRRVARAIAVLGGTGTELLSALSQVPPHLVTAAVQSLRDDAVFVGSSADFAVEAMRAAVLDELSDDELLALRTRAVRVLNDASRPVGEVADQLLRLSRLDEPWMLDVLRDAAAIALRHRAGRQAARYLTRLLDARPDCGVVRLDLAGALLGTDPEAAVAHLEQAILLATDTRTTARIAAKYAWASLVVRNGTRAVTVLRDALAALEAELADPPAQADLDLVILLRSMTTVAGSDRKSMVRALGTQLRTAPAAAPGTPGEQHLLAVRALLTALDGTDIAATVDDANRALRGDDHEPGGWSAITSARALFLADKVNPALEGLNRAVTQSRRRHDGWTEYLALSVRSHVLGEVGEMDRAAADAEAAVRAAERGGRAADATLPKVALAVALRAQSQSDRADRLLDSLDPDTFADSVWEYHLYLMAKADSLYRRHDYTGALRLLTTCGSSLADAGIDNPVFAPWWMHGTWVLIQLGRRPEAAGLADTGKQLAVDWHTPRSVGFSLLASSAVTPGTAGIDLLTEAVDVLGRSAARVQYVRAQYLLGQALLRIGDKAAARERLRQAVLLATRYGFSALSGRARDLLLAAGGRMPFTSNRLADVLTSSERRVAELAADGATNRDIAEALFVTLRTVEFHLNNVYRKLDLDSRSGLASALEDHEPDPSLLGTRPIAHPLSARGGTEVHAESD